MCVRMFATSNIYGIHSYSLIIPPLLTVGFAVHLYATIILLIGHCYPFGFIVKLLYRCVYVRMHVSQTQPIFEMDLCTDKTDYIFWLAVGRWYCHRTHFILSDMRWTLEYRLGDRVCEGFDPLRYT